MQIGQQTKSGSAKRHREQNNEGTCPLLPQQIRSDLYCNRGVCLCVLPGYGGDFAGQGPRRRRGEHPHA